MDKVETTALLASASPAGRVAVPRVRIGACRVEADLDRVVMPAREITIEPKAMAVLMYLAQRPGQVVSTGELIDAVWQGRPMGDNPVYHCIAQLRRALGDDPRAPTYISTVPTKGYRLIAPVEPIDAFATPAPSGGAPPARGEVTTDTPLAPRQGHAMRRAVLFVLLLVLLAVVALLLGSRRGAASHSVTPVPSSLAGLLVLRR